MFSMSQPVSAPLNGNLPGGLMDGSGTINPAALNASALGPGAVSNAPPSSSPRGTKRSRSPESYGGIAGGDDEESKRRKRGRPPKSGKVSESPISTTQFVAPSAPIAHTPQLANQPLPQTSPPQASPTKSTPTKSTVLKALPTVRDHTTDQLNPEGDEYIPREIDEAGERKVTQNGQVLDGRQYRCRTFFVPNRGDKLFMLATECARVLGYRDSYLLFNKNRSLHKIIANQAEKDDLIQQEILPYSYRSRQIAIVTARSMFRQFGSRLIVNGRRVRDDYWEGKARKQGFTEEDAAGEKRPGAAKQREAQQQAEASTLSSLTALPHGQIIYSNGPGLDGMGATLAPLPMINPQTAPTDDMRPRDYSNVQRPRHEISGPPYLDRTQPSSATEILNQAGPTAEFNKVMGGQRQSREKYLQDMWNRPHDSPVAGQRSSIEGENVPQPAGTQALQSPQMSSTTGIPSNQQSLLSQQQQHSQSQIMSQHAYANPSMPQSSMVAQSPVRQNMHHPQMPQQQAQRSPSLSLPAAHQHNQPAQYGYQPAGMWPPPQPQPSPLAQQHHPGGGMAQYQQHMGAHQQSPHMGQRHSPMHQAPHPGQPQTPQLHHQGSSGSMHQQMAGYAGMPQAMYPGQGQQQQQRSMYAGGTPTPQQFLQQQHGQPHTTAGGQPSMQGWAGQQGGGWGQGF